MMKLGTKLSLVAGGLLTASIVLLSLFFINHIRSDCSKRMQAYENTELAWIRQDIKGYVDLAYRILSDHYDASSQNDYIIRNYGARLRYVVESAECVINEKN